MAKLADGAAHKPMPKARGKAQRAASGRPSAARKPRGTPMREVFAFTLLGLGALSVYLLVPGQAAQTVEAMRAVLMGVAGLLRYLLPAVLLLLSVLLFFSRRGKIRMRRVLLLLLFVLGVFGFCHLFAADAVMARTSVNGFLPFFTASYEHGGATGMGAGALGALLSYPLYSVLDVWGAGIVLFLFNVVCLILLSRASVRDMGARAAEGISRGIYESREYLRERGEQRAELRAEQEVERQRREEARADLRKQREEQWARERLQRNEARTLREAQRPPDFDPARRRDAAEPYGADMPYETDEAYDAGMGERYDDDVDDFYKEDGRYEADEVFDYDGHPVLPPLARAPDPDKAARRGAFGGSLAFREPNEPGEPNESGQPDGSNGSNRFDQEDTGFDGYNDGYDDGYDDGNDDGYEEDGDYDSDGAAAPYPRNAELPNIAPRGSRAQADYENALSARETGPVTHAGRAGGVPAAGGARSGGGGSGGGGSGGVRSGDARSGDARSGDARSGDVRSGDARSGDARSGGARSATLPGQPAYDAQAPDFEDFDTERADYDPDALDGIEHADSGRVPGDEPMPASDAPPDAFEEDELPPFVPDAPARPAPAGKPRPAPASSVAPAPSAKPPEREHEPYNFPPVDLLALPTPVNTRGYKSIDAEKSAKLEDTLHSFGISAKVVGVSHGPAITRFELQPAPGIKVSRITSLADDIALNLAALSVRIEAPIPGKAAVGVEIPNDVIETVMFREVLESEEARKNPSRLAVALGKDNAGRYIIADIAKMPHVLIAGATGAGKSVCINNIVCSILYRATPEEVRLIMIDPKVVELSVYNGIPHLLVPVVTDPKKAAGALNWAVVEMTERYKKFAERGARDMKSFNMHLKPDEKPLPQIVVIVDELADLMMVAPGEVEDAICRLAQLARAAGIHLVIATQRPSVNVITGVIKANIPSRVAFTTSSYVDSRTILDMGGAEKLLGRGDMLYYPTGVQKPLRVQGAYVHEDEVHAIAEYVKAKHAADYNIAIEETMNAHAASEEEKSTDAEDMDDLLPQAVMTAVEMGQTSISMLQRRLRIGYARAGRLIDEMTQRGYITQAEGAKPRNVLITREECLRLFGGDILSPR